MPKFSAIIVGAGLNGFFAGLTLQRAGIDFIILEKREAADQDGGSSLCLWPHAVRVLDQLGLLEDAKKTHMPVKRKCTLRRDGSVLSWSNMIEAISVYHGHPWMLFQRSELLDMLRNHLSNPEKQLLCNKAVTSIESQSDGAKVTCADGSMYNASMVIGADGVNGVARLFVDGDQSDVAEHERVNEDFTTTYIGLYGRGHALPSPVEVETIYETHAGNFSTQFIVPSADRFYFLVYHKLPEPTRKRHRVTSEDVEELVEKYGDAHIAPSITLKQAWDAKNWWYKTPLEEGVSEAWYRGRVLLLGDSAHKMTPNLGFGLNCGLQSTVVLNNLLRTALADDPDPSPEALTELFAKFDAQRRQTVKKATDMSGEVTRAHAWDTWLIKMVDQYILPYIGGDYLLCKYLVSPLVRRGLVLDFLPEPNFRPGTITWANQPITKAQ